MLFICHSFFNNTWNLKTVNKGEVFKFIFIVPVCRVPRCVSESISQTFLKGNSESILIPRHHIINNCLSLQKIFIWSFVLFSKQIVKERNTNMLKITGVLTFKQPIKKKLRHFKHFKLFLTIYEPFLVILAIFGF